MFPFHQSNSALVENISELAHFLMNVYCGFSNYTQCHAHYKALLTLIYGYMQNTSNILSSSNKTGCQVQHLFTLFHTFLFLSVYKAYGRDASAR